MESSSVLQTWKDYRSKTNLDDAAKEWDEKVNFFWVNQL
jgi:hypothetical protein